MSLIDARTTELKAALTLLTTPRPLAEWHEDMGPVLWWCWEIPACGRCDNKGTVYDNVRAETFVCPCCEGKKPDEGRWLGEAPYCGSPLDLGKEVMIETGFFTIMDGSAESIKPHVGYPQMNIYVGGWPGYHTHWTPLPQIRAPEQSDAAAPAK